MPNPGGDAMRQAAIVGFGFTPLHGLVPTGHDAVEQFSGSACEPGVAAP